MTTTSLPVSIRSESPSSSSTSSLHLLPFHISYSGPANIKGYFNPVDHLPSNDSHAPSAGSSSSSVQRAYFRGRMLLGSEIQLPDGYRGQVWKSNGPSISIAAPSHQQQRNKLDSSRSGLVSTEPSYGPESPRRSPRKHGATVVEGEPALKKQKVNVKAKKVVQKKKKKKTKMERFDMSPDQSPVKAALQEVITPIDLDALPVDGIEPGLSTKEEEQVSLGDSELVAARIKQQEEAEVPGSPIKVEGQSTSAQAPQAARETTPPASSATSNSVTLPISIPSTPTASGASTPFSPSTFNIQTPKPFSAREGPDVDEDADSTMMDSRTAERVLVPISQFQSFTIWNPDTELDRGDDCYVKAVDEWTKLAHLVS